jgi:hypothetical protein
MKGIFQYLLFCQRFLATARFILANPDKAIPIHVSYFAICLSPVNPHLAVCAVGHLGEFYKDFYKWNIGVVDCRYFRIGDFHLPYHKITLFIGINFKTKIKYYQNLQS